ncbi:MAG TPA: helical backbone metal receptor [Chitinophagales bacterium]|nr:helical backbone metal receptor [Chitinophagales bacterium]
MIYTDQLGRKVELTSPPRRIVSLVPSITETLFDLELDALVVGRTRYCIHPKEKVDNVTVVGGTKKIVKDRLLKLKPDLLLANKEENTKEDVEWCTENFPTWISDVVDVKSASAMIESLGELTNRKVLAEKMSREIQASFEKIHQPVSKPSVVYLIWRDPFMAAGADTFISQMLDVARCHNIVRLSRYPVLMLQEIVDLKPDFVLLSTEPYRFTESHVSELQNVFVQSKIALVDGEMFSWYGSRMLKSADYFQQLKLT